MKIKMESYFYCVAAVPELLIMVYQPCWALCVPCRWRDEGTLPVVRDGYFGNSLSNGCLILSEKLARGRRLARGTALGSAALHVHGVKASQEELCLVGQGKSSSQDYSQLLICMQRLHWTCLCAPQFTSFFALPAAIVCWSCLPCSIFC